MDPTQPGHTPAKHGKEGETAGVDLRGSSVPTNADDVSMDVPDAPTEQEQHAEQPSSRADRSANAERGRQQSSSRRE